MVGVALVLAIHFFSSNLVCFHANDEETTLVHTKMPPLGFKLKEGGGESSTYSLRIITRKTGMKSAFYQQMNVQKTRESSIYL